MFCHTSTFWIERCQSCASALQTGEENRGALSGEDLGDIRCDWRVLGVADVLGRYKLIGKRILREVLASYRAVFMVNGFKFFLTASFDMFPCLVVTLTLRD